MQTKVIHIVQEGQLLQWTNDAKAKLEPAVESLRSGTVVAIPTETVYGLAANAFDAEAVKKIYIAKGRPSDNPLIVHVSDRQMLNLVVSHVPPAYEPLMQRFWPGPITFLFPKSSVIPDVVTAGLSTVAVRMPSHPIAQYLIERSGCPLAAPSANTSGKPSPTLASHVVDDLDGLIPYIVDGGPCSNGIESTVVNLLQSPPMILRPGSITLEMLQEFIPDMTVYTPPLTQQSPSHAFHTATMETAMTAPLAPGMKYVHYAPNAKLVLVAIDDADERWQTIQSLHDWARSKALSVGLLATTMKSQRQCESFMEHSFLLGNGSELSEAIAHDLFRGMRALDALQVDLIVMETIDEANEGLAIMNRIGKAATCILQSRESLTQACVTLLQQLS